MSITWEPPGCSLTAATSPPYIGMVYAATPRLSAEPARPADILTYLLEQPNELIGEVVQWLDLRDLLSLRITSRRLHHLVHCHGPVICARFLNRLRHSHGELQIPATIRDLPHGLVSLIELQYRFQPIHELSLAFSHHISINIQLKSPFPDGRVAEFRWRARKTVRLYGRLFPCLFALQGFLESLRRAIIQSDQHFAGLGSQAYLALKDVYDLDQQHIIESVYAWSEENIVNITAALQVFVGIAAASGLTMASRSPKYPFASIQNILVFQGLIPFMNILGRDSVGSRGQKKGFIAASERVINAGRRPRPTVDMKPLLPSIHHLDTDPLDSPAEALLSRPIGIRNDFFDSQNLWYKAAHAVLQRKCVHPAFPPDTNEWLRGKLKEPDDPPFDLSSEWTKVESVPYQLGFYTHNYTV